MFGHPGIEPGAVSSSRFIGVGGFGQLLDAALASSFNAADELTIRHNNSSGYRRFRINQYERIVILIITA